MKKLVHALALFGLATVSTTVFAEDSPHVFTGNLGFYSDYSFRGVSQTAGEPAIQGGFDYTHASGVYLGTWASNVAPETGYNGSNMEWDFYGGYNGKVNDDLSYNVGLLKYYYPGQQGGDADTLEFYAGITYKWVGLKVSYNLDDYFGVAGSDGTTYWDLSFNYTLPGDVALGAHYGWTRGDNIDEYEDWKIGVSKPFGGFTFGLAYTNTSSAAALIVKGEDVTDGRVILSVSKTF